MGRNLLLALVVILMPAFVAETGAQPTASASILPVPLSGSARGQSILSLANLDGERGTAHIRILTDDLTVQGVSVALDVPAHGTAQYALQNLQALALPQTADARTAAVTAIEITANFSGIAQQLISNEYNGAIGNLSACATAEAAKTNFIVNANSTRVDDLTSLIGINNTGHSPTALRIAIYDATSGEAVGSWTSPVVPRNGSALIPVKRIEDEMGFAPSADQRRLNLKAENTFTGFLQHLVTINGSGLVVDLTAACNVGVGTP